MLKLLLIFVCASGFAGIVRAQEPLTVDVHMKAGAEAQQAGRNEEALQHYAAVIRLEPRHFGAQFAAGFLYFQTKTGVRPRALSELPSKSCRTTT